MPEEVGEAFFQELMSSVDVTTVTYNDLEIKPGFRRDTRLLFETGIDKGSGPGSSWWDEQDTSCESTHCAFSSHSRVAGFV
jgi:hypothetical protein